VAFALIFHLAKTKHKIPHAKMLNSHPKEVYKNTRYEKKY